MKLVNRRKAVGQKVNPYGLRLGINKSWKSKWFVDPKEYAETLHQDLKIREIIEKSPESQGADISDVEIIRHPQRVTVLIDTGRPGAIIGVRGANIEKLGARLQKVIGKKIQIKIKEIKRPELDATLIANNVARQLRSRSSFRRAMRMAIQNATRGGIQGIKIKISGRLGGAEMSRSLEMKEGRIPLHTFRANIDYGFAESCTTFGTIGVKVWIFNGEVFGRDAKKEDAGLLLKKQNRERSGSRR
jgi:small subunit ribosomal protein S3